VEAIHAGTGMVDIQTPDRFIQSMLTIFWRGNPRPAGGAPALPGTCPNRAIGLALIRARRAPPRGDGGG
jgi:hypothetical protein